MSTRELDRDPVAKLDVCAQVRDVPIDSQPPWTSVHAAHVLPRRWKRERQLELEPDAVGSLVGHDPGQGERPPEQRRCGRQVAGRDLRADLGTANRSTAERER